MEDINKIKVIHELKNKFVVDDTTISKFIEQLDSSDLKLNIERFFRGYTVEDNFHILFAAMPWTKLVHTLGQNQLPSLSKISYQVPDFTLFFETSKKEIKPLLIETKSVKGDSQSLEIMEKQLDACVHYSGILNIPFVYAIYWEKYQTWTINTIENFEKKTRKYKIQIFDAIKNDLSIIVGDITFFFKEPLYRKTVCDSSITDSKMPKHEKYGTIVQESVSIDNENYVKINPLETAIIDTTMKMKFLEKNVKGSVTTFIEFTETNFFVKLSTLVLRHLTIFQAELNETYADSSRRIIIEFLKKIKAVDSYSIPNTKTKMSDLLYNQAFEDTWVMKKYSSTD
jgi:hypothetical protein